MVVVVDDDIDIYNEEEMAWAIGTRMDAAQDLLVIPAWNGPGGLLPTNWGYDKEGGRTARRSSAVIMDATKPAPPVQFPVRAQVPPEVVDAVDLDSAVSVTDSAGLPWLG
jgi:2,5-furandicarboxylate decarboxylase 1